MELAQFKRGYRANLTPYLLLFPTFIHKNLLFARHNTLFMIQLNNLLIAQRYNLGLGRRENR